MDLESAKLEQGTSENTENSADEATLETAVISLGKIANSAEENGNSGSVKEMGSREVLAEEFEKVLEDGCYEVDISERFDRVEQETSQLSCGLENGNVLETVIHINAESADPRNGDLEARGNGLDSGKFVPEVLTNKAVAEENSCVIDTIGGKTSKLGENWDGEIVCRICHLGDDQSPKAAAVLAATMPASCSKMDLIQLGCACKDELGIAHRHCAEAWFKLKGNRLCEICGETAKNVTGIADNRFMEEWNERRFIINNSGSQRGRCWQGQPFCNFLMACLVIAFVLPWFFRVNMF